MDEISEYFYQAFAAVLMCAAFAVAIMQQTALDSMTDSFRHIEQKSSFYTNGLLPDDILAEDLEQVPREQVIAYLLAQQSTDIYINNKKINIENTDSLLVLHGITADNYYMRSVWAADKEKPILYFDEVK